MTLSIRKVTSEIELERVYPILKELRTDLTLREYFSIYEEAKKANQYQIVCAFEESICVGFMGFRVLHDYVHGKHLYIDDLVITENHRSKGIGSQLLSFAENAAKEIGCNNLRLCTGISNEAGKKFYEREGWKFRSVVYKKKF